MGVLLPGGALPGDIPAHAAKPASSSMFESVQKPGRKLDSRKKPIDMIVVDSAEKEPTDN